MGKEKEIFVHITNKTPKNISNAFINVLDRNGIKSTVKIDNPPRNIKYPYTTIDDKKICVRRLISMKRAKKI